MKNNPPSRTWPSALRRSEIGPHAIEWDETCHFPVDVIRETAALGMAAIYVPDEKGGSGLTRLDGALIFEALAYGCPAIASYISIHNMVAWMVSKYGTADQIARVDAEARLDGVAVELLPDRARRRLGCGRPEDARRAARRHYILNGTKQFISGAGATDFYFVFARTGGEGAERHLGVRDREGYARPLLRRQRAQDGLERAADARR